MAERDVYLTLDEVCASVKRTKSTVHRWVREGSFPRPQRRGLWLASAIHGIQVDERLAGSVDDPLTVDDDDLRNNLAAELRRRKHARR
jgi:predicted DNA-binding transcriptional regulator AlpA